MRALLICSFFLTLLASEAYAQGSAQRGQRIAQRNCAVCHAIARTGESANLQAPAFRTLAQRYPLDDLEEALAEGIMVGHEAPDMPLFEFQPNQIADLMAYLRSVQVKAKPEAKPEPKTRP
jgi:cytochrome c